MSLCRFCVIAVCYKMAIYYKLYCYCAFIIYSGDTGDLTLFYSSSFSLRSISSTLFSNIFSFELFYDSSRVLLWWSSLVFWILLLYLFQLSPLLRELSTWSGSNIAESRVSSGMLCFNFILFGFIGVLKLFYSFSCSPLFAWRELSTSPNSFIRFTSFYVVHREDVAILLSASLVNVYFFVFIYFLSLFSVLQLRLTFNF